MRPWDLALSAIVPANQTVFMYKPPRWAEYGLQYYRFNRTRGVFSPEDLVQVVANERRVLCISDDKTLQELSHVANVDMEVVHTIGNQSAFWVWGTN